MIFFFGKRDAALPEGRWGRQSYPRHEGLKGPGGGERQKQMNQSRLCCPEETRSEAGLIFGIFQTWERLDLRDREPGQTQQYRLC